MKHETVEEFIARGGQITHAVEKNAHGAQKAQTIKVPNTFSLGRKAFTTQVGAKGVSKKTNLDPETRIVEQIAWKRAFYGDKHYTQFKRA
jgi:hypothetical protein